MTILKRQFITDANGKPIGVMLPLDEYDLVAATLDRHRAAQQLAVYLQQMEIAAHDPLCLADLEAAMQNCGHVDTEWWEQDA